MNIWTMITLIVAIRAISNIIKSRYYKTLNKSENLNDNFSKLLGSLKNRVENLETIILEKERSRHFTELEKK